MHVRRWSGTVTATYRDDETRFGALIEVWDSTWENGTDGGSAQTLNRRPELIPSGSDGQEQPGVKITAQPTTSSISSPRVSTVAQTTRVQDGAA